YGAPPSLREIREKEIQRRKQQDVIGKIFVKGEPVVAPLIEIREGTNIDGCYRRERIIDHRTPLPSRRMGLYQLKPRYWKSGDVSGSSRQSLPRPVPAARALAI